MPNLMLPNFFTNKSTLLSILIVIAGAVLGYYILQSGQQKPVKMHEKKQKRLRTVQTTKLVRASVMPTWHASAFVIPAESVNIHAKVSGNIKTINPLAIPGGYLKKDQWLAKLDTQDFNLAVKSQQAHLAQEQASLSLVQADQLLAKEELALLNTNDNFQIDQALVLREPQLIVAKAKVSVAKNNLERALLNLSRTQVLMPFDGKVINKSVGIGSKVSSNSVLFTVVNTQSY